MNVSKKHNSSLLGDNKELGSNTIENYLTRNFIFEYLSDAVEQLIEYKNRSLTKADVIEYFAEYFKNVKKGFHVMFREYKFIMLTPYNRTCFVNNFYQTYNYIGFKGEPLSLREYYELIILLCNDFPMSTLLNCQKILSINYLNENTYSFKDFVHVLQVQLYYDEFIKEFLKIYDGIHQYEIKLANENENQRKQNEGINSKSFYESIELLNSKVTYSVPPLSVVKEILSKESKTKFNEFLNSLSKHESINNMIGKLPDKEELTEKSELLTKSKSLSSVDIIPPISSNPQPTFTRTDTNISKFAGHIQTAVAFNSTIRRDSKDKKIERHQTRDNVVNSISKVRLNNNSLRDSKNNNNNTNYNNNKDTTSSASSTDDSDSDTYT